MISFTKMHGLGNDYIYIELLDDKNVIAVDKIPSLTRYLCNRHFGVGADGIIFIERSEIADFKMSMYNQDGSQAQMCGNGIRCFAKYVYENRLTDNKEISIETLSGIKKAFLLVEQGQVSQVTVCMGEPVLDIQKLKEDGFIDNSIGKDLKIVADDKVFEFIPVSMGNPHAVIFVNEVENFNVKKYGSIIERDKIFPQKTNVEFVNVFDKSHIKMRVWERGAGETFACGTGACAALAVCATQGYTRRIATVNLRGGDLRVNWNEQDNQIYMTGIATKVFDGKIRLY